MPSSQSPIRVLFVCMGNICRSPLAEGVFRKLVRGRGLEDVFEIDSAGTGNWHVGDSPDARMQETAQKHDISLHDQCARQVAISDFETYDHILVMDRENRRRVQQLGSRPYKDKISLFREYDPEPDHMEVPDPYYGGKDGFENVYSIVERTCAQLLDHLIDEHELTVREEQ